MVGPVPTPAHRGGAGRRADRGHRGGTASAPHSGTRRGATTDQRPDDVPPSQLVRMYVTLADRTLDHAEGRRTGKVKPFVPHSVVEQASRTFVLVCTFKTRSNFVRPLWSS